MSIYSSLVAYKKVAIGTALITAVIFSTLTGAYIFTDDSIIIAMLSDHIESVSATQISYDDDARLTRTLYPSLHLNNLQIEDTNNSFHVSLTALTVQISLPRLLAGEFDIPRLIVGDSNIKIRPNNANKPPSIPETLPIIPVFHQIKVARITINNGKNDVTLPAAQLDGFSIRLEPQTNKLSILAAVHLADRTVQINASIPQVHKSLQTGQLPFTIAAEESNIEFSASGSINLQRSPPSIKADINLQASDTTSLSSALKIPGTLTAKAEISGTFDQIAAQNIVASWQDSGQSSATINGTINNLMQMKDCDLQMTGQLNEASWLTSTLPDSLGVLQNANLKAQLTCPDKLLRFEDIDLQIQSAEELNLALSGQLNLTPQAISRFTPTDLNLNLKFSAPTTRAARFLFFENVWEFGAINGTAKIRSTDGAPAVENIVISTIDPQGIEVNLNGRIDQFPLNQAIQNTGYDINVTMQSTNTRLMASRFALDLPLANPLQIKYKIQGDSQSLQLNKIELSIGAEDDILFSAAGSLLFGDWQQDDPLEDINLTVQATSPRTQALRDLLGGKEIPELGELNAQAVIHTLSGKHRIDDFILQTAQNAALQLSITGLADQLIFFGKPEINGIKLQVKAEAADTTDLNNIFDLHFPQLGQVTGTADITQDNHKMALSSINIAVGEPNTPIISAKGHIYDLLAFKEVDMSISLNLDGHSFAALSNNIDLPDLQPLVGRTTISDQDGTLGIDFFNLTTRDETLLSIEANGVFDDFAKPDSLSFTTRISAQDLRLVGALFGQDWPAVGPIAIDSTILKTKKNLLFETNIAAGDMKINSDISGSFSGETPQINGTINAQNFFIPKYNRPKDPQKINGRDYLFSREDIDFSWADKANLNLSIDIESFEPTWSKAQSANFKVSLKNANLLVAPAKIIWSAGDLTFDINLATDNIPALKISAHTKSLDPWQTIYMKDSKMGDEFKAELNLDAQLASFGKNAHELAANLSGNIYVNLQNGKIRRSLLNLVFLDFVGWTLSKVSMDNYADVQCGVADYSIADGVISTNALLLDTKNIIIAGEGSIDLKNETIDYVLLPKKKSSLIKKAHPVNINGALNSPTIKTLPWKTAATTYGSLFFAPYLFVGSWATGFFAETAKIGTKANPCQEYTRTLSEKQEEKNTSEMEVINATQ